MIIFVNMFLYACVYIWIDTCINYTGTTHSTKVRHVPPLPICTKVSSHCQLAGYVQGHFQNYICIHIYIYEFIDVDILCFPLTFQHCFRNYVDCFFETILNYWWCSPSPLMCFFFVWFFFRVSKDKINKLLYPET